MSHEYYSKLWLDAREDLDEILRLDRETWNNVNSTKDRKVVLDRLLLIYVRYRELIRRLALCHDQICQTQKRDLIRKMLERTISRMLEYKKEIVRLDATEFQYPDDTLIRLNFTPDDIAFRKPSYFVTDRREQLEERKKKIVQLIAATQNHPDEKSQKFTYTDEPEPRTDNEKQKYPSTLQWNDTSIPNQSLDHVERDRILVNHEAAIERDYRNRLPETRAAPKQIDGDLEEKTVIVIQRHWRNYLTRLRIARRVAQRDAILDAIVPSQKSNEILEKDAANFERRLRLQREYAEATERIIADERARLNRIRGSEICSNKFEEFSSRKTSGPEKHFKPVLSSKTKRDAKKKVKVEARKPESKGWQMPSSKTLQLLEEVNEEFVKNWSLRDESRNPEQREYVDLIVEKLCQELQSERGDIVNEVAKLRKTVAKERVVGGDPAKGARPKSAKGKRKGKMGEKRTKTKGDASSRGNAEDLFAELVRSGIIRDYPEVRLSEWRGDLSYQNAEARREARNVRPSMGDVIQSITEYCILPLGSEELHRLSPLVRSVCIAGPSGSGKRFLANAVCSELGALLLDLTPTSGAGKYQGKRNESGLANAISVVARAHAPSVIFVDGGHKPWLNEMPPDAEKGSEPRLLAGILVKLLETIEPGDQMLILTTSDEPYKAGPGFAKFHDKIISVPMTDYGTTYMFYQELLMSYPEVDRYFDCSSLAKVSLGTSIPAIREAIQSVASTERIADAKKHPLKPREIMERLLRAETRDPVEGYEPFRKWEKKSPMAKKRAEIEAELARDGSKKRNGRS